MAKTLSNRVNATADDILNSGAELREVEIPELNKSGKKYFVYIKPLSAGQVLDHLKIPESERGQDNLRLIAANVVDADGNPIFTEDSASRLRNMRASIFSRLSNEVAREVNEAQFSNDDSVGNA